MTIAVDLGRKATKPTNQPTFKNTIRVSNGLGPDQYQHSDGPKLGPNNQQRKKVVT